MKKIILIGGGGHCKSVIDAAESSGFSVKGILDIPELVGKFVLGKPILGTDDDIPQYIDEYLFVITVGFIKNPNFRVKLYNKTKNLGGKFATIIASSAYVSKYATIGEGSVILHQAVVNTDAIIHENCIINTSANIEHEVKIGAHSHISTGTMINGGCDIGKCVFIGSQSAVVQGITVADETIVGAKSFVNKDIFQSGLYVGSPARRVNF